MKKIKKSPAKGTSSNGFSHDGYFPGPAVKSRKLKRIQTGGRGGGHQAKPPLGYTGRVFHKLK
jgi:hypothetical protein